MKKKWIETNSFEEFSEQYDKFITDMISSVNENDCTISNYLKDEFGDIT